MGNYLKAIYQLQQCRGEVRSVDLAVLFGYSKASVCVAVKKLRGLNLIEMDSKKRIYLTAYGERLAADLQEKYLLIKNYLTSVLNVDEKTAAQDACRIEHVVSSESARKLKLETEDGETIAAENF